MCTNVDHGFDCEAHARLGCTDGFVLAVVRNVGRAVEELIDAMTAVGLDDAAVAGLGMFFNDIAGIAEQHAGLDQLNRLFQTLAGGFHHSHCFGVCASLLSNIVSLVKVTVEALVVKCHIDVDDVSVLQWSLIGDTVADGLVDRCADRLWEVHIVQRRGI